MLQSPVDDNLVVFIGKSIMKLKESINRHSWN